MRLLQLVLIHAPCMPYHPWCHAQAQLLAAQAALLERRRALERQNLVEDLEARSALEALALERSRGAAVGAAVRARREEAAQQLQAARRIAEAEVAGLRAGVLGVGAAGAAATPRSAAGAGLSPGAGAGAGMVAGAAADRQGRAAPGGAAAAATAGDGDGGLAAAVSARLAGGGGARPVEGLSGLERVAAELAAAVAAEERDIQERHSRALEALAQAREVQVRGKCLKLLASSKLAGCCSQTPLSHMRHVVADIEPYPVLLCSFSNTTACRVGAAAAGPAAGATTPNITAASPGSGESLASLNKCRASDSPHLHRHWLGCLS